MWEVSFWIQKKQTGETFITSSLDSDSTKFIEGIMWGIREVMKVTDIEARVVYKE